MATLLLLSGCSDSSKWEPGEKEASNMGVYFPGLEKYDVTVQPDDSHIFTIKVEREETDGAASVPLKVVSCPEGVIVPATVDFAAGESSSSFDIDVTGMPLKTTGDITVRIDPAYSSLYAAGTSTMTLKVTVTGGWIVLADDLLLDFTESTYQYPQQNSVLYVLEGTQRFKIPNFLNSGLDFVFTVENPTASKPRIVPYTNCKLYTELYPDSEDTYHCWYFYDTENQTYPTWSPDGVQPAITYAMFYGYSDSSVYTYINFKTGYGYLSIATDYDNGREGYGDTELYFTPKFDPFAE